jgi:GT2 family glycosyltransferase
MSGPLLVIPTFMREPRDLDITVATLESIHQTEPAADVLLVDDCSPARALVDALETHHEKYGFDLIRKDENTGFSKTVNVGLQLALSQERDAVLVNADVEFLDPGWLERMVGQLDTQQRPASVVGGLLLYPMGLIQHAGIYFSFLTRTFDHRYRFAPELLPEAQLSTLCPVTGALQFIRHECLEHVGVYDETFSMAYEDVDYCLRVFESGRECIYQPRVRAVHHESLFRGRADSKLNEWQTASWMRLMEKHRTTNMARWVPEVV